MKRLSVFLAASGCMLVMAVMTAGAATSDAGSGTDPYSDVRNMDLSADVLGIDLIRTLWFNENTKWSGRDRAWATQVMTEGKYPGLKVGTLHNRFKISGKGINVAIIDQNMYLDHPEFKGKIASYVDFDCNTKVGSMHGPAVTSLLVGTTIGTAPGAKAYYAAVPSWKLDAQYYATALNWIIGVNARLPEGKKIRVVSVSAAPSGPGSQFSNGSLWDQACSLAEADGILVLDCTEHRGIIARCFYDVVSPDVVSLCKLGSPNNPLRQCGPSRPPHKIHAPSSLRTQAEQTSPGVYSYQYMGEGGLSWSVPYVAGVLAMGWQIKPQLTANEMVKILRSSAYYKNGCPIIDPHNFISQVKTY